MQMRCILNHRIALILLVCLYCPAGIGQTNDHSEASRIVYPLQYPTVPTTCEYDGVFPLAGKQGKRILRSMAAGEHTTELSEPTDILGILEGRLQGLVVEQVTSIKLHTVERANGRLLDIRDDLTVQFKTSDGSGLYQGVTKTQQVCDQPSGVLIATQPVQCRSTTRDQWTVDDGKTTEGTLHDESKYTVEFLGQERIDTLFRPGVDVDVIRTTWDDGLEVLSYHDVQQPWCAVKVERRRLKHVVGEDILVSYDASEPIRIEPRIGSLGLADMALRLLLFGGITIGAAFGVAYIAGRRKTR